MDHSELRKNTIKNLIWRFAERCGAQIVTFAVSVVLARILDPEVYGAIAIITIFISILQVFIDSGLGNALIQKKNADDLDFSSVFYFNIVICFMLYLLLFATSPWIADFYGMDILTPAIRILGLTLVISGIKNVQQAYVSRNLLFKKFFFSTLAGTIGAAVIGIVMAYLGFGIWALIGQALFNALVDTLVLWFTVKWRPRWMFSLERLKALFSYGWKILVSSLINTIYFDLRQLIIGRLYTSADLAFYNRGQQIPNIITTNINTSIDSVLFPVLSKKQDHVQELKAMTRRAIKTSTYIMWPAMIGLMAAADSLVEVLLTDKWAFSIPYLRIFCFIYAITPMQTANINAIKAIGKSGLYLKLEVIKKVFGILLILAVSQISVFAIASSLILYTFFALFVNMTPNKKLLGYQYKEQFQDILPSFGLSLVMGGIVFLFSFLEIPNILILIIQVVTGILVYIAGSSILHFETYEYLKSIITDFIHKDREKKVKV